MGYKQACDGICIFICKMKMGNRRPTASDGARQTAAAHAYILCKAWRDIYGAQKNKKKYTKQAKNEWNIILYDSALKHMVLTKNNRTKV